MNVDYLNERSDQVKEILGAPPKWIIRSGISVVFLVIFLLVLGSAFISYNDVIPAQIVITSRNPPVYLKANSTGRLTNVFVEANQFVKKDEVLAEIENAATFEDVSLLKRALLDFKFQAFPLDSLQALFPSYLELGSLQLSYGDFLTRYQSFILFNTLEPSEKESNLIREQLSEQRVFLQKQQRRLQLFEDDLALSKKAFERNSILFEKGVLSKSEFEEFSREYLLDKQRYESFLGEISSTRIAISNFNNLLTKSDIQGTELKNNYKQQLERAYENLKKEILVWEQNFLVKSPISGRVTLFDIWNRYQNVSLGETLFTVVPENLEGIIGRVKLPMRNSGKVQLGHKVAIKLSNYPFEEWGSIEGIIHDISEVPNQGEESFYTLYIEIASLKTTFGKEIQFKQEMRGEAQIIVEELTILQRIFYQLRKVFND